MRAPEFWTSGGIAGVLLAPLGAACALGGAMRRAVATPWKAPVPVICIGNLTLGGAGKTPTVAAIVARLIARGRRPAILSRGYGGSERGPLRVDPAAHDAARVGDEPLLLAASAPVYVGGDRAASARLAVAGGADILVLDDGFQNPGLFKDRSLVVIDGAVGFGNGRVFPAGPLREPVSWGAARAQACALIGGDRHNAAASTGLPVLRADLVADDAALAGRRVLAFAGIGRPGKFFDTLAQVGAIVAATREFADHHPYTRAEIESLIAQALHLDAIPVTTAKDMMRIPPDLRARVASLGVTLRFADAAALDAILDIGTK
ncbi:MAG: tetraacyldisaccharide 4'-kinase [Proteobacteria bacterium]|nr:tetraacyldisaccharide 4'-kinase [Pseudomonadota bacterium]